MMFSLAKRGRVLSTMLATKQDLQSVATRWEIEQLRQEITLLRHEVAALRAKKSAKPDYSGMLFLGSIYFAGCVL